MVTVYCSHDTNKVLYTRIAEDTFQARGFARLAQDGAERSGRTIRVEIAPLVRS